MSAVYLFHQRMYSERHRRHEPFRLDPHEYAADRPIRLVVFSYAPFDVAALEAWLGATGAGFELGRTESYVVHPGTTDEDWLRDAYTLIEFVPRARQARTIARGRPAVRAPAGIEPPNRSGQGGWAKIS